MQLSRVIGRATATVKHASMNGAKLLVVQPLMADGASPDGDPLLAVDGVGAGLGDLAIITSDGRHSRKLLSADATPIRWTIIGVKD